jgi:hypothetical protein
MYSQLDKVCFDDGRISVRIIFFWLVIENNVTLVIFWRNVKITIKVLFRISIMLFG